MFVGLGLGLTRRGGGARLPAFADIGTLGATQDKVSGASIAHTTTAAAAAGTLVALAVAKDNTGITSGATNEITSVTDSAGGNAWTKRSEHTYTSGVAGDGTTLAIFTSILTNALPSGATITANFSGAVLSKAITVQNLSIGGGTAVSTVGTQVASPGAGGQAFSPATWTTPGLPVSTADSQVLGFFASSGGYTYDATRITAATFTRAAPVACTLLTPAGTTGGGSSGNMMVCGFFGIFPASGAAIVKDSLSGTAGGSNSVDLAVALRAT